MLAAFKRLFGGERQKSAGPAGRLEEAKGLEVA